MATSPGALSGPVLAELPEWSVLHLPGLHLAAEDRRLVECLVQQRRFELDELQTGLRIRSRSWVGSVDFKGWCLRIRPKLSGGTDHLARMVEVGLGLEGMGWVDGQAKIEARSTDLQELIALLFARASERVLRKGLRADYVEHEEWLGVVRGKILPDRQVLERFGMLDRVACRFDELERDVPDNRLLAATVRESLRRARTTGLRARLARLRSVLDSVCDASLWEPRTGLRGIVYDRLNDHYREAHELAALFWAGTGTGDLLALSGARSKAFLLDMNALFERYVLRWLQNNLGPLGYKVDFQRSFASVITDELTGKTFQSIRPDLVLRRPDGVEVPLDTKYKLYEGGRPPSGDVYQAFLYGYSLSGEQPSRALLIYPRSEPQPSLRFLSIPGRMGHAGARLGLLGLPLVRLLGDDPAAIEGTRQMFLEATNGS